MGYLMMNPDVDECGNPCTECGEPVEDGRAYCFDRPEGDTSPPPWPVTHFTCLHKRVERMAERVQS